MNGSDNPPPPDVEQTYLKVEKELLWPNPVISSATAKLAVYSGESGVKMTGPYEYVAPSYWQTDKTDPPAKCNQGGCGGAYGFNTETSMGPAVPPIESIRAMVGKDHMWPIDDTWNYHAGGGVFKDIHVFTDALNARFGEADSVEDYAEKAQLQTYEGVRAMYEAYSRNKYVSTGVIQWMLNNAWPSMIWHLYDFYLRPGGGYFGAKKVTGSRCIRCTDTTTARSGWSAVNMWMRRVEADHQSPQPRHDGEVLAADHGRCGGRQHQQNSDAARYRWTQSNLFLVLRLEDASGKTVGSNFYWLSTKPETLDWEKSNWYTTPTSSYADYTALAQLPKVRLNVVHHTERKAGTGIVKTRSLTWCWRIPARAWHSLCA